MKNFTKITTLVFLLCSIFISAQNNSRRANQGQGTSDYAMEKRKEDFEKEKEKNIEKTVLNLKTILDLDELQFIAIKQIITESIRNESIILKKEESDEEKMKAIKALSETNDKKIIALLNASQKEKFDNFRDNLKRKKK